MRRRGRTARRHRVAATEEEMLRKSDLLTEQVTELLRSMAFYAGDIKEAGDSIVKNDDGFLFLIDDISWSLDVWEEAVDELNKVFRAIKQVKRQHEKLSGEFQELSEEYMGPAPRR